MNIQAEKALIAQRVEQINDPDLILAIKNLLDFGLKMENQHYIIPEHHKSILDKRLDYLKENPKATSTLEELKKKIEDKL